MNSYVGIDLGTTNSTISIALMNAQKEVTTRTLQIKQIDDTGQNFTYNTALPSVLYIDDKGMRYVGIYAKKMIGLYPKRVIRESKRVIGTNRKWKISEEEIRAEEVAAHILKVLKNEAEKHYGKSIDSTVITVPANFNFQRRRATVTAAKLAGFDESKVHTIAEPTAALLDFIFEEKKLDESSRRISLTDSYKNLLVVDIGGGTCDVSILQVKENSEQEILINEVSISQYMELGGYDFDNLIANYLVSKIIKEMSMSHQEFAQSFSQEVFITLSEQLLNVAELAKKYFSLQIDTVVVNEGVHYEDNPSSFDELTFSRNLIDLPEPFPKTIIITKKEYDTVISPFLYEEKSRDQKNIETPMLHAIETAKTPLNKDDIDAVFLVGGMTLYPSIAHRVYEIFNKRLKPIVSLNPMEAISRGAAIYHYYLDKISVNHMESENGLQYTPMIPENIYVDTIHGEPILLVKKGLTGPFSTIFENEFYIAGTEDSEYANAMELELFEAEEPNGMTKRKLHSAVIIFKNPVRIGTRVIVSVHVTRKAEIHVKAWVQGNEEEVLDVDIQDYKYTDEKIEQLQEEFNRINKL